MEETRNSTVSPGRFVACLPGLLVWTLAALSASRWLASIGRNQLEFADTVGARVMPILWLLIMIGLPIAGYLANLTARGRVSLIWQLATIALGFSAVIVTLGD